MQNLAGHKQSTEICTWELTRCGIEVVPVDEPIGEPKSMVKGQLGAFEFTRAWYYWCVNGPMPLELAKELYADPCGRVDIRVTGHCGCPAPEGRYVTWLTPDGRKVLSKSAKAEFEAVKPTGAMYATAVRLLSEYEFSDDPAAIGARPFVTSYHIDSELGLFTFAEAVRRIGRTE